MKGMFATHYERIVAGVGLMALMASVGISWTLQAEVRRIKSVPVTLHLAKADFRPSATPATIQPTESWPAPFAQSSGGEWIYDVFTPPVIFYDRLSARFSVTPAGTPHREDRDLAFELLSVKRELFRVQLSGYAGVTGSYIAIFTRPGSAGTLLARESETLKEVGLVLKHFAIEQRALGKTAGDRGFAMIAQAELQDARSGAITVLDSESKTYDEALIATVKLSGLPGATREVREGDLIANGDEVYRVSRIESDPSGMIVTREQAGLPAATRLLRPVEIKPAATANFSENPTISRFRPATGIADNVK